MLSQKIVAPVPVQQAAKRVNSHPDQPFRHECAVSSVSYASHLFPLLLLYFGYILCWSCVVMCMWCAWLVMCVFVYFECHVTIFVVFAGALSFIMCNLQ